LKFSDSGDGPSSSARGHPEGLRERFLTRAGVAMWVRGLSPPGREVVHHLLVKFVTSYTPSSSSASPSPNAFASVAKLPRHGGLTAIALFLQHGLKA
jgi:hypothetical protein